MGQHSFPLPFSEDVDLLCVVLFCAKCRYTLGTHSLGMMSKQNPTIDLGASLPPSITSDLLRRMRGGR